MARIRCWIISRRLQEYLDGELSDRSCQAVQKHVAGCDACRHLLADYKAQVEVASSIRLLAPPDRFTDSVMARLEVAEARHPARVPVRSFSLAHAGWVAAAFAALAMVIGYWVNNPTQIPVTSKIRPERPRISERPTPPSNIAKTPTPTAPSINNTTSTKPAGTIAIKNKPQQAAKNRSLYASKRLRNRGTDTRRTVVAIKPKPTPTPDTSAVTDPKVILSEAENSEMDGRLEDALAAYEAVASNTSDPHTAFLANNGRGRVFEKMGMDVYAFLAYDDALNSSGGAAPPDGSNSYGTP